jgi:uncharacterized protein (TIGR03437 family)
VGFEGKRRFKFRLEISEITLTALKSISKTVFLASAFCLALAHSALAQAPVLAVSPSTLVFNYTLGSSGSGPSQAITVTAASGTGSAVVVSTSISYSSGGPTGWLLIPSPTGLPGLAVPASVNVFLVNVSSLSPGAYSATITLNYLGADPSSATTVAVFLTVAAAGSGGTGGTNPGETITATPSSLAFSYAPGGAAPAAQVLTVAVGDGAAFTVAAVTNDGNPWLAAAIASTTTVNVTTNPTILSPGSYTGTITLTAPGASTQVSVTLAVGGVGLSVNPAQLSFTIPQNYGFGAPMAIQVTSTPSASIMAFGASDNNWLVVDTPTAQTPATITIRANDASLPQGSYVGSVTIQTSPTNAVTVPVSLIVGPPATLSLAPGSLSFSYTIGNAVPAFQTTKVNSLTGVVQSFSVTSATSDGAAWLSATATSPTPGVVNVSVNPVILAAGSYTGVVSVLPLAAGSSAQPIAVSLTVLPPPTPVVSAVVSSASYVGGAVAPGEFVTLFGAALGPAALITPPAGTFPTSLGGTMVTFGGLPAPILYASATQTTVQVPYGIAIGQTILSVQTNGVFSSLMPINSVPAFPGFFTSNFSGKGQIAALNQDYSLNSPSNPAARGSVIILYGTGEGATVPASIEGRITPVVAPFPQTQLPVSVTFQGVPAVLQYYGETPGAVSGLLQINAVVPAATPPGPSVSVLISINGQSSPGGTTVSVK